MGIAVKDAPPHLGPPGGRHPGRQRDSGPHRSGGVPANRVAAAICLLLFTLVHAPTIVWGATKTAQEDTLYIIHLRNGGQLRTFRYWEAGSDYRIEISNGVVGLHKADVARIEVVKLGAATVAGPTLAPAVEAPAPPPRSPGIFSQLAGYVGELVEWMRGWMERLWTPRRPAAEGPQAGARPSPGGGVGARGGSTTRGNAPPLFVVLAVFIAVVPSFLFCGKALGAWLFRPRRIGSGRSIPWFSP